MKRPYEMCNKCFDVKKFIETLSEMVWKQIKTSFPCASAVRPLAVSSAQISASAFAVWLPEASVLDYWAWSPQEGLGSLFSTKQENIGQ